MHHHAAHRSRDADLLSPAGLTRGSLLFVRTFLRTRWIAGSSPAMTSVIAACVCPSPGSPAFAGSPPSPRKGRERVQTEFAARAELRRADSCFCSLLFSRHGLDQHGTALAAADAFGGDALLDAEALHGVDEMQHDAVAARAHGMAEADGAAIDVELVALDAAGRAIKSEHLAAERVVLPGGEAAEHLRGEGFVELPQPDVGERQRMPT